MSDAPTASGKAAIVALWLALATPVLALALLTGLFTFARGVGEDVGLFLLLAIVLAAPLAHLTAMAFGARAMIARDRARLGAVALALNLAMIAAEDLLAAVWLIAGSIDAAQA